MKLWNDSYYWYISFSEIDAYCLYIQVDVEKEIVEAIVSMLMRTGAHKWSGQNTNNWNVIFAKE